MISIQLVPKDKSEEELKGLVRLMDNAVKSGNLKLGYYLKELKAKQPKRTWTEWVKNNLKDVMTVRTADRYIKDYSTALELGRVTMLEAMPTPPTPKELRQERMSRREAEEVASNKRFNEDLEKRGKVEIKAWEYYQEVTGDVRPEFTPTQEGIDKERAERSTSRIWKTLLDNANTAPIKDWKMKYKAMALILHPDKGGTTEAMAYLNEVNVYMSQFEPEKPKKVEKEDTEFTAYKKAKADYGAWEARVEEWLKTQERGRGYGTIIVDKETNKMTKGVA